MVRQRLHPTMQDHGRADLCTQVLVVGGDRSQRLGCRLEQDGVDHRLIVIGDGRNRRRQREYDGEICEARWMAGDRLSRSFSCLSYWLMCSKYALSLPDKPRAFAAGAD